MQSEVPHSEVFVRKDDSELPDGHAEPERQTLADKAFSPQARSILLMLDELNRSPNGAVVFRQIRRILGDAEQEHAGREKLLTLWLGGFLRAYAAHLEPDTPLYVQVKLLIKQMQQPLSFADLKSIQRQIDLYVMHLQRMPELRDEIMQEAFAPLLQYYGHDGRALTEAEEAGETVIDMPAGSAPRVKVFGNPPAGFGDAEQQAAATFQNYLSSRSRTAEKMQQLLAEKIQETIDENRQFGSMLESVQNGLEEAENIQDIETLRRCLLEDVAALSRTHNALVEKLQETKRCLRMIETDSRKLNDELARVKMLSMTDELTGLPNRRAFLRRLEDEVGRTRRYGFRLALVMIDLDHFKSINDRYGHAGGDTVLRTYAEEILTVFRQHDLVARYGGEEFAVLLPNTDEHGAMAALNKVRRAVSETRWEMDGHYMELPTFSAGLTLFVQGDDAQSLIQRADEALYSAKNLGRNRIEIKYGVERNVSPLKFRPMAREKGKG